MKIENIKKFVEIHPQISDLVDVAYLVDFYADDVKIQGDFKGEISKKYLILANLKIDPATGYIEGAVEIENLKIGITLT